MFKTRFLYIPVCILLVHAQCATAVELFGLDLKDANADNFIQRIENAGVEPVPNTGEARYKVYDSSSFFPGSNVLYLGFAPESKLFAFAEYEFSGKQQRALLAKLNAKYGKPEINKGVFSSDTRFKWVDNGIEIELSFDWYKFNTRLSYVNPVNLAALINSFDNALSPQATPDIQTYY